MLFPALHHPESQLLYTEGLNWDAGQLQRVLDLPRPTLIADSSYDDWADWEEEDDDEPMQMPVIRTEPKTGRNDTCPCGSGKKYKKCCLGKLEA